MDKLNHLAKRFPICISLGEKDAQDVNELCRMGYTKIGIFRQGILALKDNNGRSHGLANTTDTE